jgi:hypothetical protein
VQRILVDVKRGQILEQRAVAPAVDRCVHPFGRQTMISSDSRSVLADRRAGCGIAERRVWSGGWV